MPSEKSTVLFFFYTEMVELDKDEQGTILMSFIERYC